MKYWVNYLRTWLIIKRKHLSKQIFKSKTHKYTKFVILCQPRTGSTWLHTLLNSHPQIFSHGEVLRKSLENNNLTNIQSLVFNQYQKQIKAVGLKLFYEYTNNPAYKRSYQEVVGDKNILIIHLTRKDVLAQYTSLVKAKKSNIWNQSNALSKPEAVQLDTNDFEMYTKEDSEFKNRIRENFKNHQVFDLNYEDLINNFGSSLLHVQRFLRVKPLKLFSLIRKQSESSLKEQIINWKDLEKIK